MQPPTNNPTPKDSSPEEWPTLEELLKEFTMDQILYGIHVSFEGGEEISYVDPEPSSDGAAPLPDADARPPSTPPDGASST
jgi:hypothetical protein